MRYTAVCSGLLLCAVVVLVHSLSSGSVVLSPGFKYEWWTQGGVLHGQLLLNQTCWAGIGWSVDGSMANASVFLIGQLHTPDNVPSVSLYAPGPWPQGHGPPLVRVASRVPVRCACALCVSVSL